MPSGLVIRPATQADLPAIRALLVETWHHTYDRLYGAARVTEITDRWHSLANLSAQLETPGGIFLVAERHGSLVATSRATLAGDGAMFLSRLYVLPAAQRQGAGLRMFDATIALAGDPKIITLEVDPQNLQAIKFYESLGFVPGGSVAECGGTGSGASSALVMSKMR